MQEKRLAKSNYRELPHTESLTLFYFTRQGLTTHTHAQKPSEKEMIIKGPSFRAVPVLAAGLNESPRYTRSRRQKRRLRRQHSDEDERTGPRHDVESTSFFTLPQLRAQKEERRTNQHRELLYHEERGGQSKEEEEEREPPLSVTFITTPPNVPDPEALGAGPPSPIGRAKRRRVWSDPGIAHVGTAMFPKTKRPGRRFCRPFGVACRGRKKKKSRRWSAGVVRWRRYDAGEWCKMEALLRCARVSKMASLLRCGWRS